MIKTLTYVNDEKLSTHFALHEFKCSASNTIKYSTDLIAMLEQIFNACANVDKCIITSGYRTPDYSVKVGGSRDDGHVVGIAADCKFYDKANNLIEPKYIACVAQDLGFGGIGVMVNAIHLDVRHLGGYKNKKWWGDETKGYSLSANGKDFYGYYGLSTDIVNNVLGIAAYVPPAVTPVPTYYPKYNGNSGSIATALKSLGVDGSYNFRTKIAKANGIVNYSGTAAQNIQMLNLLKNGILKKA